MTPLNAGSFQEYDYNNEYEECEWRQSCKQNLKTL
jgi:hypothetical protein